VKNVRIADLIAMIALVEAILIGLIITANLQTAVSNMNLGSEGNQTRTTIFTYTYTGLQLGAIGIIIAAAVGLLAMILSALAPSGGE